MTDDTLPNRPSSITERPKTGLDAWVATVGYITTEYSPDAMLTIRAIPSQHETNIWSAALEWGENIEQTTGHETIHLALAELWSITDQAHPIFKSDADAVRSPGGYTEFDWIDADTKDALDRLAWTAQVVFQENWSLIIIYQATDDPISRVQMRLNARDRDIYIGGRGPALQDAAEKLFRNATPHFTKRNNQPKE